jgi:hypothetical protein
MPRSQVTRSGSVHTAEFPPKSDDGPPKDDAPADDSGDAEGSGHPADDPKAAMEMGMAMGAPEPEPTMHQFAPDQQSDLVVRVCPFCGSGHVIGRSDGSIECGYDGTVFTVTVMPSHPFQPMVNPDGSPFSMPTDPNADPNPQIGTAAPEGGIPAPTPGLPPGGGPVDPNQPTPPGQAPGAMSPSAPTPPGQAAGGAPGSSGGDIDQAFVELVGLDEDVPGAPSAPEGAPEAPKKKDDGPPWAKKSYLTAEGQVLDEDAYVAHLARTVLGSTPPDVRQARLARLMRR